MNCHLMEKETFNARSELEFKCVENFVESDKFDLFLCRCKQCDQLYIGCFLEINLTSGDDDYWNFWAPVTEEEIAMVRSNHREGINLIQSKRHIVYDPSQRVYWSEGPEFALMRGPG